MRIFATALIAVAAISCEKPEPGRNWISTDPVYQIVDFESATLTDGILLDTYTEYGLTFTHTDSGNGYWSGFSISDKTDMTTPGKANEYSAYNEDSSKFAVAYVYETSCSFAAGVEHLIKHADFVNSTYASLAIKDGNDGTPSFVKGPFEAGDWFKLTVKGFNAAGTQTGTVDIYLADYRDGKNFIMTDWTSCSLPLGLVNKLTFEISSSDSSEYDGVSYPNTPQYFCIDNITFQVLSK